MQTQGVRSAAAILASFHHARFANVYGRRCHLFIGAMLHKYRCREWDRQFFNTEKRWNRFARSIASYWRVDETCISINGE
jgi:hypothetical protein